METVYKASKTIILFLIVVLVSETIFGEKVTQNMTLFILFSMLILQADIISNFTEKITKNLTN